MNCLFGLLGARVTGLEIHQEFVGSASAKARNLGVDSQVQFVHYDGDLATLPPQTYDVVFTKSVLLLVRDLRQILTGINQRLNDNGRVVFIENGLGGPLLRLARRIKHHGRWDYSEAEYFTQSEIQLVQSLFNIERIERSRIPPIYLLCGTKR